MLNLEVNIDLIIIKISCCLFTYFQYRIGIVVSYIYRVLLLIFICKIYTNPMSANCSRWRIQLHLKNSSHLYSLQCWHHRHSRLSHYTPKTVFYFMFWTTAVNIIRISKIKMNLTLLNSMQIPFIQVYSSHSEYLGVVTCSGIVIDADTSWS